MVGGQQFEVFVHHISDCHICPMSSFADFFGLVEYGPLRGRSFGTLESYLVLVGDLIGDNVSGCYEKSMFYSGV